MRVSSSVLLALAASASLARAGPCGYGLTCTDGGRTYAPCAPETATEFALVAPLLQQCDDATWYFNDGVWVSADKAKHCALSSPCGQLVPYILNKDVYSRLCAPYQKFVNVVYTFGGYCRGEPVANLPGDNGLLASLRQQTPSTTAPAPTTKAPTTTTPPSATTTPPPTTAVPVTTEPPATTAPAPVAETTSPTTVVADTSSSSASASSGPGEDESAAAVGPQSPAAATKNPVPSATTPRSAAAGVALSASVIAMGATLAWLS